MSGSILNMGFALSNWPHFHRVYLVVVCNQMSMTVPLHPVQVGGGNGTGTCDTFDQMGCT